MLGALITHLPSTSRRLTSTSPRLVPDAPLHQDVVRRDAGLPRIGELAHDDASTRIPEVFEIFSVDYKYRPI